MQIIRILRRKLSQLGQVLRAHGLFLATRLVFESIVMRFDAEWFRAWRDGRFDHRYRVKTGGFRELQQLGLSAAQACESHNYRGTPVTLFDAAFDSLPIDWKRFEFVDYGSGMGKALLLAARYPFRRVTGVEFSG